MVRFVRIDPRLQARPMLILAPCKSATHCGGLQPFGAFSATHSMMVRNLLSGSLL
jgi:hypothetical protein